MFIFENQKKVNKKILCEVDSLTEKIEGQEYFELPNLTVTVVTAKEYYNIICHPQYPVVTLPQDNVYT